MVTFHCYVSLPEGKLPPFLGDVRKKAVFDDTGGCFEIIMMRFRIHQKRALSDMSFHLSEA